MMVCMCGHLRYDGLYVWTRVMIACMCGHKRYDVLYVWALAL